MKFDLRQAPLDEVRALCEQHHGYQSAGGLATYCFGVYERLEDPRGKHCQGLHAYGDICRASQRDGIVCPDDSCDIDDYVRPPDQRLVAGYTWQPPSPGASTSVCPEAPHAVLALSRMVAVPKSERQLKHVSKPLMAQMNERIDRSRWPVLVTYSDEGQGHTGYVYQCSGWEKTSRARVKTYVDAEGRRVSPYSNGEYAKRAGVTRSGYTFIQRWEHWVCERGYANNWLQTHGWERVEIKGKRWRSGNQAFRYERYA